jgi:hypothetical protein
VASACGHQRSVADHLGTSQHQLLRDVRTHRGGNESNRSDIEFLDQASGVSHHRCRRETVLVGRCANSAIVERDGAVAGREERRYLMQLPGSSDDALAGDEQHGRPLAAVVVDQFHNVGFRLYGLIVRTRPTCHYAGWPLRNLQESAS